jgi:integrase
MRIVRRILNTVLEWGYLSQSPLKKGMVPSRPEKEHPTLSLDQVHELLELLEGRNKYVVALFCLAGLRRSEAFGLKWDDIDFRNRTIAIRRQFTQGRIQPVKTDLSRSTIPMNNDLVGYLKAWRLQSGSPE